MCYIDPATNLVFPINLNTDNEWKRLVGLGVRAVTFLNMNVYVVGMYMKSEDIGELKKLDGWKVIYNNNNNKKGAQIIN